MTSKIVDFDSKVTLDEEDIGLRPFSSDCGGKRYFRRNESSWNLGESFNSYILEEIKLQNLGMDQVTNI